jgi:hypothetical protein
VKNLLDFCPAVSFYVLYNLDYKLFNDHILMRVLLTPLKFIAKFLKALQGILGQILFEKNGEKKEQEGASSMNLQVEQ